MSQAPEQVVALDGVSFRYPGAPRDALQDLSFSVKRGEMVMVMGHGGAGKSTLCNLLIALIPYRVPGQLRGTVHVFGESTQGRSPAQLARKVGLVFQDFESQLFSTNVELEVAFAPQNLCVPREDIQARVYQALSQVGLLGFESRQPATLSGGEKQRLAIASVLSLRPELLCLDEATSDLDPVGKARVFSIARDFSLDVQRALIIVDHQTEEAHLADRAVLMKEGAIVADGPPREVLADPDRALDCGVMAPQIAHAFSLLGVAARDLPFSLEEGLDAFRARKVSFKPDGLSGIEDRDRARGGGYGEPIIQVQDLVHEYSGFMALRGVSLDIRKGEFVAILGQNGSGKTTLVKHLNGLLSPTKGDVSVLGRSTAESSVVKLSEEVGYVFQNPDHQIFNDTVYDEVSFSLKLREIEESKVKKHVLEALDVVGLADRGGEDPFSLTKGERQRVAVASVLAARPSIIIMDEPTTGLDYVEQCRMMDLLRALNERGHTIIAITHSMWVAAEYAHRVVVMADGTVVADGPVRRVFGEAEGKLVSAGLIPPPICRLSTRLGHTLLSVGEFKTAVKGSSE